MSKAACVFAGPQRAWEDEAAGFSDGEAVRPSWRMEGCSEEAYCSWPAGPMAAFATGDGGWRGQPSPTGAA